MPPPLRSNSLGASLEPRPPPWNDISSALGRARKAAGDKDLRIGGVSTIRQYLGAGLIDELHLALTPVLLGEGEQLLSGMNLHDFGFAPFQTIMGENAMHVFLRK